MTDRTPSVPVVPQTARDSGATGEPPGGVHQANAGRDEGSVDGAPPPHERYTRRLLVHLAAYAVLLVALAPFMRLETAWTVDEGLYAYQVEALRQGDWDLGYWAESIDPEGRWFPLRNFERGPDSYFPYVKTPAYPTLMWAATRVLGETAGLHVLPIVGALVAAAAAWLLASLSDRRVAPYAFWIAALGPLAVNAFVIWAHTLSAGVAGLTAYAVIRGLNGRRPAVWMMAACLGAACGVLVRTEGLLFAAALSFVLGVSGAVRLLQRRPGAIGAIGLAGAMGSGALAINLVEGRWVSSVVGRYSTNDYVRGDALPYWRGKLQGARHVLFEGTYYQKEWLFDTSVIVAVMATLAAGVALRRSSHRAQVAGTTAAFVAIAALIVRFIGLPQDTVPGIIPAWPLVVLGLLLFKWRAAAEVERLLLGVVVLELLATLATQYNFGGGKEWGARYLSPIYPLIAVLAAIALYAVVQPSSTSTRRHLLRSVVLLTVLPAVAGLGALPAFRATVDQRIKLVEKGPEVVITSEPWLAQRAFRTYPEHKWMHVPIREVPIALDRLAAAGYKAVAVMAPLRAWSTEPSLPGGYEVRRDLGEAVYLAQP